MKWFDEKLGRARIAKALANSEEEALYAQAALEVSKGEISSGLRAKAIADAEGDELKAHARYIGLRVEQLRLQRAAAGEIAKAHAAVEAGRRQEDARRAAGGKSARAHTAADADRQERRQQEDDANDPLNGMCPNCHKVIPLSSLTCPKCEARFGEGSSWKVLRRKKADALQVQRAVSREANDPRESASLWLLIVGLAMMFMLLLSHFR